MTSKITYHLEMRSASTKEKNEAYFILSLIVINEIGIFVHYLNEHSDSVVECLTRDRGFEPHRRHCIVSLNKAHLSLLSTGSTQEDSSRHN